MRTNLLPLQSRDLLLPSNSCISHFRIAWSFITLVGVFVCAVLLAAWTSLKASAQIVIVSGWLISLALHEFAHAMIAYKGGDTSINEKGYLNMDLLNYVDPMMTFIIPTLLLLIGGIALPGGSVAILSSKLFNKKWETLTALAGPIANVLFGCIMAALFHLYFLIASKTMITHAVLPYALAMSVYYQIMASVLNLIPLPPLDGWNAVSPWLPENCFLKRWMSNEWHAKSISLVTFAIVFLGARYIPGTLSIVSSLLRLLNIDPFYING